MRGGSHARLLVAAVAAAIALTGCGVPTDSSPRAIADADVPGELLAPNTTTSTTSTTVSAATVDVTVFLVGPDGQLVAAIRPLTGPIGVGDAVRALLEGATDDEAAEGIRSAIPTDTRVLSVVVREGVARIDLSAELIGIQGEEQISAVAQLVFTATSIEGVTAAQFLLEGEPVDVPRGDGTLTSGELTRSAYPELAPVDPDTTTTTTG